MPHEEFAERILLDVRQEPGNENITLADLGYKRRLLPQRYDILPSALPYKVASFTQWEPNSSSPDYNPNAEAVVLPKSQKYKLNLTIDTNGSYGNSSNTLLGSVTKEVGFSQVILDKLIVQFEVPFTSWIDENELSDFAAPITYPGQIISPDQPRTKELNSEIDRQFLGLDKNGQLIFSEISLADLPAWYFIAETTDCTIFPKPSYAYNIKLAEVEGRASDFWDYSSKTIDCTGASDFSALIFDGYEPRCKSFHYPHIRDDNRFGAFTFSFGGPTEPFEFSCVWARKVLIADDGTIYTNQDIANLIISDPFYFDNITFDSIEYLDYTFSEKQNADLDKWQYHADRFYSDNTYKRSLDIKLGLNGYIINRAHFSNIDIDGYHAIMISGHQSSDRLLADKAKTILRDVRNAIDTGSTSKQVSDHTSPILSYVFNGQEQSPLFYDQESYFSMHSEPDPEGEFLNYVGQKYMHYIDDAAKKVARYTGGIAWPGNHIGVVSLGVASHYLLGTPFRLSGVSYVIDVPRAVGAAFDIHTGDFNLETLLLTGFSGSNYESYIWQENTRMDAVSSVRGIQYASELGIEIVKIDFKNDTSEQVDAKLLKLTTNVDPSTNYDNNTINILKSLRYSNGTTPSDYVVIAPQEVIQYGNWRGTTYIAYSMQRGEFRFSIGPYNGGYTAAPPQTNRYDAILDTGWKATNTTTSTSSVTNTYVAPANLNSANTLGQCGMCVKSGDPVNMITGNMDHSEQDFSIKAPGLPIVFTRTYNSREAKDGSLGYGWSHSFGHKLLIQDDDANGETTTEDTDQIPSSIVWTNGTGGEKTFTITDMGIEQNDGGLRIDALLASPTGETAVLGIAPVKNAEYSCGSNICYSTQLTVTEKSGLKYNFEISRAEVGNTIKLASIEDRNENKIYLTYDGNKLFSVMDSDQRTITFSYHPNTPHIHQITDWSGRTHTYEYENDNLVRYKNPLATQNKQSPTEYTYYSEVDGELLAHAMRSYTFPDGSGMSFKYYLDGRVFQHNNALGETMTFSYNDFRRESVTVNERGLTRQFFFNEDGLPIKIVDEEEGITTYKYEDPTNPFSVTAEVDVLGNITGRAYDVENNLIRITHPSMSTVEYSHHNQFGRPGKIKDANGNYTLLQYDADGNVLHLIKLKSGIGASIDPTVYVPSPQDIIYWAESAYASNGNLISRDVYKNFQTKKGLVTKYAYSDEANGIDGLNNTIITRCGESYPVTLDNCVTVTQNYDNLGRLNKGVRADLYATELYYDVLDRVVKSNDQNGELRQHTYNSNNQLLQTQLKTAGLIDIQILDNTKLTYGPAGRTRTIENNASAITSYEHDELGNVIKVTNPDGYSVSMVYSANNHWVASYDEEGNMVSRTLDALGRPRTITLPDGSTTQYVYYGPAKNSWLKQQIDPLNRIIEYDYDSSGNVTQIIEIGSSSSERITQSFYDELNRATRVVQPEVTLNGQIVRNVTKYVYDNLGNQIEMWVGYTTDLTGYSTAFDVLTKEITYQYDEFGRLQKEIDPIGNAREVVEYDIHDNPTKLRDPKGQITEHSYLYGGRIKNSKVFLNASDTNPHETNYEYNMLGLLTSATTPDVSYSYGYDDAQRVNQVTDHRGNKKLSFGYSPGGLLNSRNDSEGHQVNYLYDPVGRLTGIWASNGDIISYIYDNAGRIAEKWHPNGAYNLWEYNQDNSIKQMLNLTYSGATLSHHQYLYDEFGNRNDNIDALLQVFPDGSTQLVTEQYKYIYDNLNRITEVRNAVSNDIVQSLTYDQYSNRQALSSSEGTQAYFYDVAHQLTEIRQNDSNGAIIASFGYDVNGNMTSKTLGSETLSLVYNPLDQLVEATQPNMDAEKYSYAPNGNRISKTIGSQITNYLYNGPDIIASYDASWNSVNDVFTHGPFMDDPLIKYNATSTHYFHQDGIGNVVGVTNNTQQLINIQRFDAWGNSTYQYGTPALYSYAGREFDATGLIYFRVRYYDPSNGRFTQRDPLGVVDTVNRYTYALNNPVNYNDPWGLFSVQAVKSSYFASMTHTPSTIKTFDTNAHDLPGAIGSFPIPNPISAGANILDAGLYAWEGNKTAAGISLIGAIGGGGVKLGAKVAANVSRGVVKSLSDMFKKKGFESKGPDPVGGKGTFVNPKTGRPFHIDANHPPPKPPHVGVGRPRGARDSNLPKSRDFDL